MRDTSWWVININGKLNQIKDNALTQLAMDMRWNNTHRRLFRSRKI
jgi:hypothetical protein